jgi:hypothetical protein
MRSARGRLTCPLGGAESSENSFFVSSIFEECIQTLRGYGGKNGYQSISLILTIEESKNIPLDLTNRI